VDQSEVRPLVERIQREDPHCTVLGARVYHNRRHRPDYVIDMVDTRTGKQFAVYSEEDWIEQERDPVR
jgi:hypothetical protein